MSAAALFEVAEAAPAAFDPAAYLADLERIGVRVLLVPGGRPGRICMLPADGQGFGNPFLPVSQRWAAAIEGHPDHVGAVVEHLLQRDGAAS